MSYMYIHRPRLSGVIYTPDIIQKLISREDMSPILYQILEQLEFSDVYKRQVEPCAPVPSTSIFFPIVKTSPFYPF